MLFLIGKGFVSPAGRSPRKSPMVKTLNVSQIQRERLAFLELRAFFTGELRRGGIVRVTRAVFPSVGLRIILGDSLSGFVGGTFLSFFGHYQILSRFSTFYAVLLLLLLRYHSCQYLLGKGGKDSKDLLFYFLKTDTAFSFTRTIF